MSPHNCNETLSPSKDGDDESERVPARLLHLSERQVQRLKPRYQPDSVGWVQHGNRGRSMPWAVSVPLLWKIRVCHGSLQPWKVRSFSAGEPVFTIASHRGANRTGRPIERHIG
jgi:hypothetical protein